MRKTIFNTVNLNCFLGLFDNTISYTRYMNWSQCSSGRIELKRGHTSSLNTVHVTAPDVVGSNTSVLTGGCPEVDCRIVSNHSLCSGRAKEKEGMRRGISAPILPRNLFFFYWRKSSKRKRVTKNAPLFLLYFIKKFLSNVCMFIGIIIFYTYFIFIKKIINNHLWIKNINIISTKIKIII